MGERCRGARKGKDLEKKSCGKSIFLGVPSGQLLPPLRGLVPWEIRGVLEIVEGTPFT